MKTLWQLPVPATALLDGGPVLEKRLRREIALRISYELEDEMETVALVFVDVEAFKVTYDRARGQWMLAAYDRLLDQGRRLGSTRLRGISDSTVQTLLR